MPRGSPFTRLCRQFAGMEGPRGADLHVHTTASDGAFTPSQAVALAYQAKLAAIAITDHDTLVGLTEARRTAADLPATTVEVVSGVEITTRFEGRELHLLGYYVSENHVGLQSLLKRSCELRRVRFLGFLDRLATNGTSIPAEALANVERTSASLGRRHLASLLLRAGLAKNHHDAWQRYVAPVSRGVPAPEWPGLEEAIATVRASGGVPGIAHPPETMTESDFDAMKALGLQAIEVSYPWNRSGIAARLKGIAAKLDLLPTGGSDCHGAMPAHRAIGSTRISMADLQRLRERAGQEKPVAPTM